LLALQRAVWDAEPFNACASWDAAVRMGYDYDFFALVQFWKNQFVDGSHVGLHCRAWYLIGGWELNGEDWV
jgi:hypothetical protein